jgi:hypothetical protein
MPPMVVCFDPRVPAAFPYPEASAHALQPLHLKYLMCLML